MYNAIKCNSRMGWKHHQNSSTHVLRHHTIYINEMHFYTVIFYQRGHWLQNRNESHTMKYKSLFQTLSLIAVGEFVNRINKNKGYETQVRYFLHSTLFGVKFDAIIHMLCVCEWLSKINGWKRVDWILLHSHTSGIQLSAYLGHPAKRTLSAMRKHGG